MFHLTIVVISYIRLNEKKKKKKNTRGVFIKISWKFDIIFIRYTARYIILSKANKKSYLRSLRQRYFARREDFEERNVTSLLSSARTPFILADLYREQLVALRIRNENTCVGFVRLHHANDVTRAKYAPMASHTPWLQTDEYTVSSRFFSRILKSFLPDTVIRNWNNLAGLLLRRYLVIEWTRYNI